MARIWSKLGIASQLYLLGAIVFLPIAVIIALNIYGDYRQAVEEASRTAFRHARNVAEQTARFNRQSFKILQGLVRHPAIRAMSSVPCDPVFDHFLSANNSYANLLLDNADGDVICNAAKGPNLKGLVTHRPWFKSIMATGKRQVGDPTVGRVVGRWIAALAEPVIDDAERVRGALVLTVDLWNYQFNLDRDFRESFFLVSILDSQGAVVARSREPDQWVGKKIQVPFEAIRSLEAGDIRFVTDASGVQELYGYAPVAGTDWVVLVSSPKSIVSAEVWDHTKFKLTLAGLLLVLLFTAAFLVARRIQEPIKAIAHAAEAVGDGRFDVHLPETSGSRELGFLAQKFNHMVEQRNTAEMRQAQAMADLATSEENLRLITDSVPAIISYLDADLRYRFINRRYTDAFGLRAEDVYGKHLREIVGDAAYDLIEGHFANALNGNPVTYERSQSLPGGEGGHFETRLIPRFSESKSVDGCYALTLDVTERKHAEGRQRLTASVFDNATEGILITDKHNNILSVNRAFTEITGYSSEEAIGKNPRMLSSGWQSGDFYQAMWKMIRETGRWQGEVWDKRKDGRPYCELLSIAAIRDDQGEITQHCAIFSDITKLKVTEAELMALNTELEERVAQRTAALDRANKELEAFSYSVSHDLRSPLRHISGFSAMVLQENEGKLDATSVDYLKRINAATERMGLLIADLLALSRVSRQELNKQDFDLSELVGQVVNSLVRAQPEREVRVTVKPEMKTYGDPGLVRIVLENLTGNAWKFTSRAIEPEIEVGLEERDGETVYYVRDNGAGFDMKYADKLFSPFQRLHTDKEFQGTGIGLSIVQRIVVRHGGRIWAESVPGHGATFYFTLV